MSDVMRFNVYGEPEEDERGNMVLYADYDAIKHERNVLEQALRQRQGLYDVVKAKLSLAREALRQAAYYITGQMETTPKALEIHEMLRAALASLEREA